MKLVTVVLTFFFLSGCVHVNIVSQQYSNNTEPAGLCSNLDKFASEEASK